MLDTGSILFYALGFRLQRSSSKVTFMNTFHVRAFAVGLLIILSLTAQTAFGQIRVPAEVQERLRQQDWLTADIKLDNRPYAKIRASLDERVARGEKPINLERRYRLQGQDAYNPQKIFRWAYSAYLLQQAKPEQNFLSGVEAALNRNLKPGAYDWIRLRFLVSSERFFASRPTAELIKVGRRLLQIRYDDDDVMFDFVRMLQESQSMDERKLSLALARDGAQKNPRDAYWQWAVANSLDSVVHYATVIPSYRDAQQEIAEYKKTLQLMPTNDPNRRGVVETIVHLQLLYDSKGNRLPYGDNTLADALKKTTLR